MNNPTQSRLSYQGTPAFIGAEVLRVPARILRDRLVIVKILRAGWWPCFVCESLEACQHREKELVLDMSLRARHLKESGRQKA